MKQRIHLAGEPVDQGIWLMPAAVYHSDPCPAPSLSNSIAKVLLSQSPYHAFIQHPRLGNEIQSEESSRFDIGSAAHSMLLENDDSVVVVIEADDWRKKETKEKRDEARAAGKYPVLAKDFVNLVEMVQEARGFIEQTEMAGIFEDGDAEQTIIWQENSIWCRIRTDWLTKDRRIILDYKTCQNAEPNTFGRHMTNMSYDVQAAFYKRGLVAVGGPEDATFLFLAQEIEPPYACSLHALSNIAIEMANEKVEAAIHGWRTCIESEVWPQYTTEICYQEPPAWAITRHMETMEMRGGGR